MCIYETPNRNKDSFLRVKSEEGENTREKRERERILCPFCLLSRALFLLALCQQEGS